MDFTVDDFLGGKIKLKQLKNGYRATSDAVNLAASLDKVKKNSTILDVGAGTGAVSLCLAARFPEAFVTGIELQNENFEIAKENIVLNDLADRVSFINGDIFDKKTLANSSYDYVFSNPPFMDKNDYASPNESRDKTRREIDIIGWVNFCVRRTKDYGKLHLIFKPDKLPQVLSEVALKMGEIKIYPLYSKEKEEAKKIVLVATKSSKGKMEMMPPIVFHNDDGTTNDRAIDVQKNSKSFKEILQK